MKRRDAIKTAIGSVLGLLAAPFVAKAAPVSETIYLKGVPLVWVPYLDGPIGHTHSLNMEPLTPGPHDHGDIWK